MVSVTASLTIAAAAVSFQPVESVTSEVVDLIEVNHFYDEQGRLQFDQVIYYDWSEPDGRYQVRAWRMLKSAAQIPRHDRRRNAYVATWYDADQLRRVSAASFRETWTQHDPEMVEREFLPKERRRGFRMGLGGPRK